MNWNLLKPLTRLFAPAATIAEATPVKSHITREMVERANLRMMGRLPPSPLVGLSIKAKLAVLSLPESERYAKPIPREVLEAAGREAMHDHSRTIDI